MTKIYSFILLKKVLQNINIIYKKVWQNINIIFKKVFQKNKYI
jgi:hypothetical protein